jgi:hypothetical protein
LLPARDGCPPPTRFPLAGGVPKAHEIRCQIVPDKTERVR